MIQLVHHATMMFADVNVSAQQPPGGNQLQQVANWLMWACVTVALFGVLGGGILHAVSVRSHNRTGASIGAAGIGIGIFAAIIAGASAAIVNTGLHMGQHVHAATILG